MNETHGYDHCESLYWVFTHRCNDICAHCYNASSPQGSVVPLDECLAIVRNLPARVDRLILSGGEPLTESDKLLAILDALRAKYGDTTQLMLQTNGDLLNEARLDALLARGVTRIDIASIDRFHTKQGAHRDRLVALFTSRGMVGDNPDPLVSKADYLKPGTPSYGFWGSTEELWLGGRWARGRAMEQGLWSRDAERNFCAILSGARGFLGGTELPQEIAIHLWRISPCCPETKRPLGDARRERVADVLERASRSFVFQRLNQGDPFTMGVHLGIDASEARERTRALGNVCLWCDEFYQRVDDHALFASHEQADEDSRER